MRSAHRFIHCPINRLPLLRTRIIAIASAGHATQPEAENEGYWTLREKIESTIEVKKSKFIAKGWPVKDSKQAMALIAAAQDPSASHNCFAYKLEEEIRSSDDGEPGGTAGKPILSAITGEGLDGLGAGGLVRAYGGAARDCLRSGKKIFVKPLVTVHIKAGYEHIGVVYQQMELYKGELIGEEYHDQGNVVVKIRVERSAAAALDAGLRDGSSGLVSAAVVNKPSEQ